MEDSECVICFENISKIKFNCGHMVCCIGCYARLQSKVCPLCRGKIKEIRAFYPMSSFIIEQTIDEIIPIDLKSKLFRLLKKSLKSSFNSGEIVDTLTSLFIELNKDCSILPKYTLSYQQADEFLNCIDENLKDRYMILKAIVAMCREPWKVSNKAGCGLCYHGNFGEIPDINLGIEILKYNYKICKSKHFA